MILIAPVVATFVQDVLDACTWSYVTDMVNVAPTRSTVTTACTAMPHPPLILIVTELSAIHDVASLLDPPPRTRILCLLVTHPAPNTVKLDPPVAAWFVLVALEILFTTSYDKLKLNVE